MTLLTVANKVALDVGLDQFDIIAANTAREAQEMLSFINAAGVELSRRVDWGSLTYEATITGDGTSAEKTVNAAAMRLTGGVTVKNSSGGIVRPLTRPEWNSLTLSEGTPRYFLLEDTAIQFFPYLASADTCTASYQSKNWTSAGAAAFTSDTQTALFPEDVLALGAIVRWRRQKGMPYQDQEAEYEGALEQYASYDDRGRF